MSAKSHFSLIDPAKSPFFYGYVILAVGALGLYCSIPGQTIGVSVFTGPVKDALDLSRNQFTNAYIIGTICSSLVIGRAGVWFDTYGGEICRFFCSSWFVRGFDAPFVVGSDGLLCQDASELKLLGGSFYHHDPDIFYPPIFGARCFVDGIA